MINNESCDLSGSKNNFSARWNLGGWTPLQTGAATATTASGSAIGYWIYLAALTLYTTIEILSLLVCLSTNQFNMKTADKASITIIKATTTKAGLKEMESNKACTPLIRRKLYELVRFLRSYKVQRVEFFIRSDRSDWTVNDKYIEPFRANPLLGVSKLVSYALAQLI